MRDGSLEKEDHYGSKEPNTNKVVHFEETLSHQNSNQFNLTYLSSEYMRNSGGLQGAKLLESETKIKKGFVGGKKSTFKNVSPKTKA